eukprot:TRINITY_DN9787_c0_g1_i2.p4 TRINITY_DN9787_c0_g1~~TRINITY_DN9787_c0_g1_i2.p4  ORF type:complete len:257 (-),score=22.75 TRINITY_DN9787_c0_g1_i2:6-776(-)
MERLFADDVMTKRQRVEAALSLQPVDRVPILEQLSYNPRVIADWTGKAIEGFDYTVEDICAVIRQTSDLIMPPVAPSGTDRHTTSDGFVYQHDNWMTWRVSRPFTTAEGARDWLAGRTEALAGQVVQPAGARAEYRGYMSDLQARVGETVILKYHDVGFCSAYDSMGLELFSYLVHDYPEVFGRYMAASGARRLEWVRACLLYTSDAADDMQCVDLGGRRTLKKKKTVKQRAATRERARRGQTAARKEAGTHITRI